MTDKTIVICCVLTVIHVFTSYTLALSVRTTKLIKDKPITNSKTTLIEVQTVRESDLPECDSWSVCNKIDTYSTPWIERQCRCSGTKSCSTSLDVNDGHTVIDKSKQFKLCEPINKLPICRYFRDITWTLTTYSDNTTSQTVNCVCPKNSVAYIFKHQIFKSLKVGTGYKYHFACSPETRLRCERKEPCRLFTVRKRPDVDEVNTNTLCQCPQGSTCPTHHKQTNVITAGTVYGYQHIRTYSGYCSKPVKYTDNNDILDSKNF